jgi:hypothetical protein
LPKSSGTNPARCDKAAGNLTIRQIAMQKQPVPEQGKTENFLQLYSSLSVHLIAIISQQADLTSGEKAEYFPRSPEIEIDIQSITKHLLFVFHVTFSGVTQTVSCIACPAFVRPRKLIALFPL